MFMWFWAKLVVDLPLLGTYNRVWFFAQADILGWFRILMLIYGSVNCLLLPTEIACCLHTMEERFNDWALGMTGDKFNDSREPESQRDCPWVEIQWSQIMICFGAAWTTLNKFIVLKGLRHLNDECWIKLYYLAMLTRFKKIPGEVSRKDLDYAEWVIRTFLALWGLSVLVLTIAGVEQIIKYNDLSPQTDLTRPGQIIPFVLGILAVIEGAAYAFIPKRFTKRTSDTHLPSPRSWEIDVSHDEKWQVPIGFTMGESAKE
jgi:hypothetical protein